MLIVKTFLYPFFLMSLVKLSFANTEELDRLQVNDFIIHAEKIEGKVWPKILAKAYLRATPLESIAIFAAYDLQKTYVPNLVDSKVIKQEPANEAHVNYKMDLPWPLGFSYYIHGHRLKSSKKDFYEIDWFLVKSDAADEVNGRATFEPYKNGTLMTYEASVKPKSIFAGVLKKLMLNDVKITLKAIIDEIEKYRISPGKTLPEYKQKIIDALNGKVAYP